MNNNEFNAEYQRSYHSYTSYRYLPSSTASTTFIIVVHILVFVCVCLGIGNIFYVVTKRKYRESPVYSLLLHTLVFGIMTALVISVETLTSIVSYNSDIHLINTNLTCFLTNFAKLSIKSSNIFQVLLIWLILMSERNLTSFQWLYNDYSLRRAQQASSSDPETPTGDSITSIGHTPSILELRNKALSNFVFLRARHILLYSFYVVSFGLAIMFSWYSTYLTFEKKFLVCKSYDFPFFDIIGIFLLLSLPLFFIPALYLFALWPTVFGKFFGGARDPLLVHLKVEDIRRLKYIRVSSFFKWVDGLVIFIHFFALRLAHSSTEVELYYIATLVIILIEQVLFAYYERVFSSFGTILFTSRNISGSRGSLWSRLRGLIFKKNSNEVVDYKNFVDGQ